MNKAIVIFSAGIALVTTVTAFSFYREGQMQQQQLADYGAQVEQLLDHLEDNTRQRLEFKRQIAQLNSELLRSGNRIKSLDTALVETQAKISPDYGKVEQEIRKRVTEEFRRQYEPDATPSAVSLINQISQLDQEDRMAIMQVQGQYGGFLNSLNTSAERKERITQALIDVTLGQNQARAELFAQGLEPRELRSQMTSIMGSEYTREALSYELNDAELGLFDEYQQQNQNEVTTFVGDTAALRIRGGGPGGPRGFGGPPGSGGAQFEQFGGGVLLGPEVGTEPGQSIIIRQLQPIPATPR